VIDIIPMAAADWARLRDLRLEMLADTPTAYVESLAEARQLTDADWQKRAKNRTGVVAVDRTTGRYVGTMSSYTDPDSARTWLVAVYVAPDHRGTTVADRLLDAVEADVAAAGHTHLWLDVHESNTRAQRFYRRRGYTFSGHTTPYPLDPTTLEQEMVRPL
jgi:ribosomal protein S18 acetylase RimI-like enzyme